MFYVFVLFLLSEYVYDYGYPFGMNSSILEWWKHPIPEKYRGIYKGYLDDGRVLGMGWWRAQNRFRWGDMFPEPARFVHADEDSLVKWAGERGMHILPVFGYTALWAVNKSIPEELKLKIGTLYPPDPSYWGEYKA